MNSDFSKCMPIVLRYEGGFSNHPRDPGGVTLEGIIQRVFDGYRTRKGLARQRLTPQMRGTTEWIAQRDEIYRLQYWNAIRGDELPAGVDLVVFDGAVNSGPFQSVKWLQRALGVEADGHLGEGTLAALQSCPDHDALIADICARRLGMLKSLSTWHDFGAGWSKRVANVKSIGQAWATGSVGPEPVEAHEERGDAKAYASDVLQPAIDAGDATKIGIGSTSVSAVIRGAQDQLQPLVGTSDFVNKLFLMMVIAGVGIGIVGFGYSIWASRKSKIAQRAIDGNIKAEVPDYEPVGAPA